MNWKAAVKHAIPPAMLNNILLTFPFLYKTGLVKYETNIFADNGIEELLSQLGRVLGIEGDIVECGCSRCGATIHMANLLHAKNTAKKIFACDSFEGFDLAELKRERELELTGSGDTAFTSTSFEYVKKKIRKLGVDDIITPVKGYFQDTLPKIESGFCFAFIDCDLKDSIIYCAETIWPKLSSGGRIVFDDYTSEEFKGSRLGIDFVIDEFNDDIIEHGLMNRLYYCVKK